MSGARPLIDRPLHLAHLLLLGAALVQPTTTHAQTSERVLIVTPSKTSMLLDEALVRVRGELAAMGWTTELRTEGFLGRAPPSSAQVNYQGALVFERFGDWLRIQAWNPATSVPVTQWIDASDASVDAELVGVRAVEALRAVLLVSPRTEREKQGQPATDASTSAPDVAEGPSSPPGERAAPTHRRATRNAWLGPSFAMDLGTRAPYLGAQFGFFYAKGMLGAGVRLEGNRASIPADAAAGNVDVTRLSGALEGRTLFPVGERWDLSAVLGAGAVQHRVEGVAETGYIGRRAVHTSLVLSLEFGTLYWFSRRWGAYGSSRGSVAFDAPVLRVDGQPIATLERPLASFSVGLVLGLD